MKKITNGIYSPDMILENCLPPGDLQSVISVLIFTKMTFGGEALLKKRTLRFLFHSKPPSIKHH
jgi:hypothetical protein